LKALLDGAHYHVSSKTCRGLALFGAESIRDRVYQLIRDFASVYYVSLHEICVLDNRYHVVLTMGLPDVDEADLHERFERYEGFRTGRSRSWDPEAKLAWYARLTDLSRFMKDLNQWIAAHVNKVQGETGTVFGERFKSCLLEDGKALFACMAHVACQPIRRKMATRFGGYLHSSLDRYIRLGDNASGVTIPAQCISSERCARKRHRLYANRVLADYGKTGKKASPDEIGEIDAMLQPFIWKKTKWLLNSIVIGSKSFVDDVMEGFMPGTNKRFHLICGWLHSNHVRAGPYLD